MDSLVNSINAGSDSKKLEDGRNHFRNAGRSHRRTTSTGLKLLGDYITKGASCGEGLSTLMTHHSYSIVVGLQITNYTKHDLVNPCTTSFYGVCPQPAVPVAAGSTEILIARKHGFTPSGSDGIASWLIQGTTRRVFVLWDVPYFSQNRMAVGFKEDDTHGEVHGGWCNDIKISRKNDMLVYQIESYNKTCKELKVQDTKIPFIVKGTMGGGSKPKINIEFRPEYETDLASNLSVASRR